MADPDARPGPDRSQHVVLVDDDDVERGTCDKVAAHLAPGVLHRALSVFLLGPDDQILLQRRASAKAHFAGLWSNSCCTHPWPGEPVVAAGERRVEEELGLRCSLVELGSFTYRAPDPVSGMVEHEFDHVLLGRSAAVPVPNPLEVSMTARVGALELRASMERSPEQYTPWLAGALAVLTDTVPL